MQIPVVLVQLTDSFIPSANIHSVLDNCQELMIPRKIGHNSYSELYFCPYLLGINTLESYHLKKKPNKLYLWDVNV